MGHGAKSIGLRILRSRPCLFNGTDGITGTRGLSANYFGDLIKKETGKSAQEYIQAKIIDGAKSKISDPHKSINEVAFELGFKYPQHFTRMFKQRVGYTLKEFRSMN
jgi:AraC family transcriptional regulator, transcriptional activator of pobA